MLTLHLNILCQYIQIMDAYERKVGRISGNARVEYVYNLHIIIENTINNIKTCLSVYVFL